MQPIPPELTTIPTAVPWGGGAIAVVLILTYVWRGGLRDFLKDRKDAAEKTRTTDLAIAVANANMAGSLERAMLAGERTMAEYDKLLTRHESVVERHERILAIKETDK